jgi:hypothetical protein
MRIAFALAALLALAGCGDYPQPAWVCKEYHANDKNVCVVYDVICPKPFELGRSGVQRDSRFRCRHPNDDQK